MGRRFRRTPARRPNCDRNRALSRRYRSAGPSFRELFLQAARQEISGAVYGGRGGLTQGEVVTFDGVDGEVWGQAVQAAGEFDGAGDAEGVAGEVAGEDGG